VTKPGRAAERTIMPEMRRVLSLEAHAISLAAKSLDKSFAKAVSWLQRCRGKIVATGVGKSGHVAEKIAATFSSTGTPAVYLDPLHALHGGLGLVGKDDIVILLGKSGESQEINDLLPRLRSIGARLIAMTSNPHSTLAKGAHLVLHLPVAEEACPLNLAPTTSTTLALAAGDAMAVALMKLKGFKAEHFARNHPGGRLGRRLTLAVADVMRSGEDNPVALVSATMAELLDAITRGRAGAVSIIDERGKLRGLVTDFDVRQALLREGKGALSLSVKDVMNHRPVTARPDMLAAKAARLMEDRRSPLNVLPVVDRRGRALGMLQIHDLRTRGL
jgi:arabinose-5-phosphate isomerase